MKLRARRPVRGGCKSDLSRNPSTIVGYGPLPCEVKGDHITHQRWSAPVVARWTDISGGGRCLLFVKTIG